MPRKEKKEIEKKCYTETRKRKKEKKEDHVNEKKENNNRRERKNGESKATNGRDR